MRAVIQRVKQAYVKVEGKTVGKIDKGILVYLGIEKGDSEKEIEFLAKKILDLRIFPDDNNKMNLNVLQISGSILSVSQFTLSSRIKKGRRPDFNNAEKPEIAEVLYNRFNEILSNSINVQTGVFGAMMEVFSINDGPVTFIIEKSY